MPVGGRSSETLSHPVDTIVVIIISVVTELKQVVQIGTSFS
jgi:hypothetical protein